VTKKRLEELRQDPININKHSERGSALTRKSIEKFGARLAGIVDRRGVIIDGNDRQIAYGELDLSEVEIVKADPTKPVYLQFDDLDLTEDGNPARELQVALHRSAVESWTVDAEALLAHMQTGVEVDDWFHQNELDQLLASLQPPIDPATEWQGMPEYRQENKDAFQSIHIHFKTQEDRDAFAVLIEQKITDSTRSIWFPQIEIERYADKRWVDES
jgi:hypothetical protein